jgi:hypothetical protein
MTNWKEKYNELTDSELNKIAILRVMECTNGVIQHSFRDKSPNALPVEETRATMKFSMSCMKNMTIPLKEETITFKPKTQELLRRARELYISGVKQGNQEDFEEFFEISRVSAQVCGIQRLLDAKKILEENVDVFPPGTLNWGVSYLLQFFTDEYLRDFFESKKISDSSS